MTDVLLLILLVGAFAAFAGYVRICDRVVGPDDSVDVTPTATPSASAATPTTGGATVNLESIVGLVIAAGLFAYLVVTLIWPERF
jgi:K+-transporting ATPase KdpF subunit